VRVVIAGGHGQIALRLQRQLTEAGHSAVGIVRNPDHVDDVQATGAEALVLDLEDATVEDLAAQLADADAIVFAAGAGPGSGIPRKDTVDRGASVLMADAAEQAGIRRFVQISSIGAGAPPRPGTDDTFAAYLLAKTAAEDDLRRRDLDWTILRPGGLTNAPGVGRVRLEPSVPRGQVSRDDVAAVIAGLLTPPRGLRQTLGLVGGDTPIEDALSRLTG
jgi:nucleoside-diphosphate-sugar epimerase